MLTLHYLRMDDTDDLDAARGIFIALLLCAPFWMWVLM
jgi:hypothetical protein